jgi:hypothetical protein
MQQIKKFVKSQLRLAVFFCQPNNKPEKSYPVTFLVMFLFDQTTLL